ncbi:MAG: hypothetical protein JW717_13385 [Marinilabiliaceae bacterium]|nr:hypothetical protein [Marinilabiliaceae bacterium]
MKKHLIISSLSLVLIINIKAQEAVGEFFNLGLNDASKIAEAYLRPYGEMLGVNLNAGWYTSAAVHKIGGFDITVTSSLTQVPSSGKTYDINSLGLTNWELTDPSNNIAPTMSGEVNNLPQLQNKSNTSLKVNVPNGSTKNSHMFTSMIQAGIGLPFHTEIMGRYMPKVSYGDLGNLQLWGIGLKHSIKEYIPVFKRIPILQLSVLGAYTNFNGNLFVPQNSAISNSDLSINTSAITSRLLIGANLPVIAFYSGVGYGTANSEFEISGSYNGATGTNDTPTDGTFLIMKYNRSNIDFNAGMRIRLGIIGIHADYSVGDYSIITGGIGINFR